MGRLLGGHYQFIKVLGSGELGQTYLVADVHLPGHPHCTVKEIRLPTQNPRTRKFIINLLKKKSEILQRLGQHEQIPQLLTYFEENQDFYLVQEFIPGEPLTAEIVSGDPLSEEWAIEILQEILEILVFIHAHGVIHGNIKPSNIIRRYADGKLVLTDLGVVKDANSHILESRGQLESNLSNAAHQQRSTGLSQEQLQVNIDLYALGIIVIQALTGLSQHDLANLKRATNGRGGAIYWRDRARISPALAAILHKMIHLDNQQCYHRAATVLADLRRITDGAPITELFLPPVTELKQLSKSNPRRSPLAIIGTFVPIVVTGLVVAYALRLPHNLMAQYFLHQGKTEEHRGKDRQAIERYTKVLELQPNNDSAYDQRGRIYSRLGESQKALADFSKAIQLNPRKERAYYQRGNIRWQLGDRQGAKDDYTQALQIDPTLTAAYVNRGSVLADLGDEKAAVKDYTQAIELEPNLAAAYLNRCLSRSNLGDQRGAIADCTQAINIRPNHAFAYQNRGLARRRRGDVRGAIEDYNVAIQLAPEDADPYYNRGLARQELGDIQGAIADYTQAIERNSNHALAYYDRGLARANLGNRQDAIADLQQAAKLCLDLGRLGCYEDAQYQLNQLRSR
ncbi:MAG TPA: serine/threonine protein kinase [Cyanobacteria bacterium UBA8803]|nr:serine/threonine protein kinase [Cyanobacteria bacterium UBA9273]HBL60266.1 serine/threonine protein kinase [Cyanobacteria bacterium UBA8803]